MIVDWNPLFRELDQMLSIAFGGQEVQQDKDDYVVTVEVPGYGPGDIEVTVDGNQLEVVGKKEGRPLERYYRLPSAVDVDAIEAKTEHGLLTIRIPKKSNQKAKRVTVK